MSLLEVFKERPPRIVKVSKLLPTEIALPLLQFLEYPLELLPKIVALLLLFFVLVF